MIFYKLGFWGLKGTLFRAVIVSEVYGVDGDLTACEVL